MSKNAVAQKPAANKKGVSLVQVENESKDAVIANAALSPYLNGAVVADAFQGNLMGSDVSLMDMVDVLNETVRQTRDGDLSNLEAMLVSQATGLQAIFTSLAKRAQVQTSQRNLEAFLGLAMKAQNQSRATIATLIDLKFPKQAATFVRQTNVSNGPQQANTHLKPGAGSRTQAVQSKKSKLNVLEHDDGSKKMDAGTAATASTNYPAHQTMAFCDRADKRGRQG